MLLLSFVFYEYVLLPAPSILFVALLFELHKDVDNKPALSDQTVNKAPQGCAGVVALLSGLPGARLFSDIDL